MPFFILFYSSRYVFIYSLLNDSLWYVFISFQCLSVTDYLTAFQYSSNSSLTLQQFLGLCPALIQQLDSQACSYEHHHSHEAHFHQVLSSAAHEHFDTDHNYTDHNHTHDHHDHDHHDHDHFNHNKEPCEERNVANIPLSGKIKHFLL